MRIERLTIKNFRNLADIDLRLAPGTVVVGENRAGKSNLVHALRLVLDPTMSHADRQLDRDDFWDGLRPSGAAPDAYDPMEAGEEISVAVEIAEFDDDERIVSALRDALVELTPLRARLTYRFAPEPAVDTNGPMRYRGAVYGGGRDQHPISGEFRTYLHMVFLHALRDVESDIRNWRRSPLRKLLLAAAAAVPTTELETVRATMREANSSLNDLGVIRELGDDIEARLLDMVGQHQAIETRLAAAPDDPLRLIRGMRLFVDGEARRGLASASLGTLNVLYLALHELGLAAGLLDDAGLSHLVMAIEEPEAHLHPHLQRLVFRRLLEGEATTGNETTTIVTTQSPYIASVSNPRSLVVLHDQGGHSTAAAAHTAELSEPEWDDIARYLDATRAELVFARRVLFVEGFAEQVLLPTLAHGMGVDLDKAGITVCAIHGTHFQTYVRFCEALGIPWAVVTDGDPDAQGGLVGLKRGATLLSALDRSGDLVANGIFVGATTLEYDLLREPANTGPCLDVLEELCSPTSATVVKRLEIGGAGTRRLPPDDQQRRREGALRATTRDAFASPARLHRRGGRAPEPTVNTLLESMEDLRRNERQWEAFNVASHCVVLAPPGSGKTKLLTTRMAYDLHTAVTAPHGVACVTLTNAAASELRQRLDHLGVARRPEVFVGTVHSFVVSRIIKPFAAAAGEPHLSSQGLATTQQCTANANRAVHEVFGHNLHSRDLSRYREQLTVARQQLTTGEAWNAFPPGLQRAEIYRTLMADRGLTDFLGLVADAVRLVEDHPALRSVLNASLPRLYVDEYQDLAPGLDRLVRHLCLDEQAEAVLFAVGDPDQAVFAFTGTRPELLLELREHPRVTPVELDQNYRSGQTLIDTAGRMRPGRPPVRGTRDGGRIQAVLCPGELDDQIDAAVRHVADLNDAGVVLHEIAVVCPQNAHCVQVAGALRASGLPARTRETSYRTTRATRLVEECAAWAVGGQETSGTRLHDVLASWRELLGPGWRRSHDVRLTGHLLRHRDLRDRSLVEFIDGIRSCAPDDPCTPTSPTDDSNELARLRDAAQGGELADLTVSEFAERVRRRDRVHISTMTLSKGLEFDVVIVIGLDEEIVPFWASRNDPAQLAEDRRKFYVSITRARESLLLLYSGAVRKPWGDINRTGPSRFLAEIGAIESPNRN